MAQENFAGAHSEGPNSIQRHHIRHEGLVVGPTAGGPARVIRLFDAYEEERIECVGNKWGAPPIIPSYVVPGSNHIFLGGARAVSSPPPDGVQGRNWSLSASYVYFVIANVGLASAFPSAKLAGDGTMTVQDATIPAGSFSTSLLGTQQQ